MDEQEIKFVIYSSKIDEDVNTITAEIPRLISKIRIDYCRTVDEFFTSIHDMLLGLGIVLVFARNSDELDKIYRYRKKLNDHYVILILGESVSEMNPKCLELYPRYTCYLKDDHTNILIVIEKMITQIQTRN